METKDIMECECCICLLYSINILQIITVFILRLLLNSQLYVFLFLFFLLCGSDFDYLIIGVWQCVLPAGVEFYPSGLDANDSSTFPKSYPIVLTGNIFFPFILSAICLFHN